MRLPARCAKVAHASSIIFKADLVTKHIDQTYRIDAGLKNGAAANPDELAAACQV